MNIEELVKTYLKNEYGIIDAESKVCQDIILLKIANSRFSKNITIKGRSSNAQYFKRLT